ncbi:MAG: hypothetical protein Q8R71_08040 [Phenylobacterium sp.]|nr:hypothetical protein [Phenylobacterium sp.]
MLRLIGFWIWLLQRALEVIFGSILFLFLLMPGDVVSFSEYLDGLLLCVGVVIIFHVISGYTISTIVIPRMFRRSFVVRRLGYESGILSAAFVGHIAFFQMISGGMVPTAQVAMPVGGVIVFIVSLCGELVLRWRNSDT